MGRRNVFQLTVDGQTFEVSTPAKSPNQRNFDWLSGPNPGYGFSVATNVRDDNYWSTENLQRAIRDFLSMIDPETGYIEDD